MKRDASLVRRINGKQFQIYLQFIFFIKIKLGNVSEGRQFPLLNSIRAIGVGKGSRDGLPSKWGTITLYFLFMMGTTWDCESFTHSTVSNTTSALSDFSPAKYRSFFKELNRPPPYHILFHKKKS